MLKNSWTLAVSVAINISMKWCFVSVNAPGKLNLRTRLVVSKNICPTKNISGEVLLDVKLTTNQNQMNFWLLHKLVG
jgi:hypothetical protein